MRKETIGSHTKGLSGLMKCASGVAQKYGYVQEDFPFVNGIYGLQTYRNICATPLEPMNPLENF
jgi:hypothetical protein